MVKLNDNEINSKSLIFGNSDSEEITIPKSVNTMFIREIKCPPPDDGLFGLIDRIVMPCPVVYLEAELVMHCPVTNKEVANTKITSQGTVCLTSYLIDRHGRYKKYSIK